jgi:hypothetical protein
MSLRPAYDSASYIALAFIEGLMDLLVQKNVIAVDDITSLLAGLANTPRPAPQ